jgi:hypothetical protein
MILEAQYDRSSAISNFFFFFFFEVCMMIDDGKGIKNIRVALLAQRVYLFLFFKLFLIWKGFKLIISRYLFNNFNMFILRIKKNLKNIILIYF